MDGLLRILAIAILLMAWNWSTRSKSSLTARKRRNRAALSRCLKLWHRRRRSTSAENLARRARASSTLRSRCASLSSVEKKTPVSR